MFFPGRSWLIPFPGFVGLALLFCLSASDASPYSNPPGAMVSSATPEATMAGVEILEAGGNAIDAAVAISFALGVSEPAGSGIGGQTFFLVHSFGKEPYVINGTSLAPRRILPPVDRDDLTGRRASTVPSTVKVLGYAWENYGSGRISWSRLLQPAIRIAQEGYLLGYFRHRSFVRYAHKLRNWPSTAKLFLLPDGSVPKQGSLIKQPILASTLRRLAEAGPEDFYNGQIAEEIDRDMRENGGWITLEDLEDFPTPKTVVPLKGTYREWDVYSLPPPTGGWVTLQALNLLEHARKEDLAPPSYKRRVWLAETLRVAHKSREKRPVRDLIDFESGTGKKIGKERAKQLFEEVHAPANGETTHFSLVDGKGTAVAVTQSINGYFGAKSAHPTLGFLYNNYMKEFELDDKDSPFYLRPGGIPYSSMSGTILAKNAAPHLILGSPGSKRIISAVVQVISYWVDVEQKIVPAVRAPRLHVVPEHDLFIESRSVPSSHLLKLELLGYSLLRPLSSLHKGDLNPYFGGVHAVAKEGSKWVGAADPRRDGTVRFAGIPQ